MRIEGWVEVGGRNKSSCGNRKNKILVARKVRDGNKKAIWLDSVVQTHILMFTFTLSQFDQ